MSDKSPPVRFLADESCDFRIVRALRAAGHDVHAIVEDSPGAPDGAVLESARKVNRILLTEDRDFGQLVFANLASPGSACDGTTVNERFEPRVRGCGFLGDESHLRRVERLGPGAWTQPVQPAPAR